MFHQSRFPAVITDCTSLALIQSQAMKIQTDDRCVTHMILSSDEKTRKKRRVSSSMDFRKKDFTSSEKTSLQPASLATSLSL